MLAHIEVPLVVRLLKVALKQCAFVLYVLNRVQKVDVLTSPCALVATSAVLARSIE